MKNNTPTPSGNASCHIQETQASFEPHGPEETTTAIRLKTNLNCQACVAKVAPALNKILGEGNWMVDTGRKDKVLTAYTDEASQAEIQEVIAAAGYTSEILND